MGSTFTVYLPVAVPLQSGNNGTGKGHAPVASNVIPLATAKVASMPPAGSNQDGGVGTATAVLDAPPAAGSRILIVEDDAIQRQHIVELLGSIDATPVSVGSGEEALAALDEQRFDCVVLDLGLPGMSGWQVIEKIRSDKSLQSIPVLVYTARELTKKEEQKLGRATKSIVLKEVRSPERLREEVTSILVGEPDPGHGVAGFTPVEASLAGRKILVVDDDIRNIFALTALLERQDMQVISVDSGREALETLRDTADIDVAIVDVMMPEMDGYETMTKMREQTSFADRPIIALTAKAMKGDREKCIEAGASDYIAKPVNSATLVAMLRSWLVQTVRG